MKNIVIQESEIIVGAPTSDLLKYPYLHMLIPKQPWKIVSLQKTASNANTKYIRINDILPKQGLLTMLRKFRTYMHMRGSMIVVNSAWWVDAAFLNGFVQANFISHEQLTNEAAALATALGYEDVNQFCMDFNLYVAVYSKLSFCIDTKALDDILKIDMVERKGRICDKLASLISNDPTVHTQLEVQERETIQSKCGIFKFQNCWDGYIEADAVPELLKSIRLLRKYNKCACRNIARYLSDIRHQLSSVLAHKSDVTWVRIIPLSNIISVLEYTFRRLKDKENVLLFIASLNRSLKRDIVEAEEAEQQQTKERTALTDSIVKMLYFTETSRQTRTDLISKHNVILNIGAFKYKLACYTVGLYTINTSLPRTARKMLAISCSSVLSLVYEYPFKINELKQIDAALNKRCPHRYWLDDNNGNYNTTTKDKVFLWCDIKYFLNSAMGDQTLSEAISNAFKAQSISDPEVNEEAYRALNKKSKSLTSHDVYVRNTGLLLTTVCKSCLPNSLPYGIAQYDPIRLTFYDKDYILPSILVGTYANSNKIMPIDGRYIRLFMVATVMEFILQLEEVVNRYQTENNDSNESFTEPYGYLKSFNIVSIHDAVIESATLINLLKAIPNPNISQQVESTLLNLAVNYSKMVNPYDPPSGQRQRSLEDMYAKHVIEAVQMMITRYPQIKCFNTVQTSPCSIAINLELFTNGAGISNQFSCVPNIAPISAIGQNPIKPSQPVDENGVPIPPTQQ